MLLLYKCVTVVLDLFSPLVVAGEVLLLRVLARTQVSGDGLRRSFNNNNGYICVCKAPTLQLKALNKHTMTHVYNVH